MLETKRLVLPTKAPEPLITVKSPETTPLPLFIKTGFVPLLTN